jgi:hypothetical protein
MALLRGEDYAGQKKKNTAAFSWGSSDAIWERVFQKSAELSDRRVHRHAGGI